MDETEIEKILSFWFTDMGPERWFRSTDEIDAEIRDRFAALHERLSTRGAETLTGSAREALAAVIALDQFPRNIYRGTAKAFFSDDLALTVARQAADLRLDAALSDVERGFLYMPYMHSENLTDQEHSVMLFRNLGNAQSLHYAIEHRDIIARFGRFPHRNHALGRKSTQEELDFLESHAGYGQ